MRSGKTVILTTLLLVGITLFWLRAWRSQPNINQPPVAVIASSTLTHNRAETPADKAIREAESAVAVQPQLSASYVALAAAYMQKVRESGDASYYGRAEAAVREALTLAPDSVDALRTLAWVQTGKHEFREALATAEQLRERQPR